MSLTFSYSCWLFVNVSLGLWSFYISLNVYFHFHGVSACLSLILIVTGCLLLSSHSHGVAACLQLSPIVVGCLSLFPPVPFSFCMSLTLSHSCLLSLTVSLVPWSCYMSLEISHYCWLSLNVCPRANQLPHVSHCLLLFLATSHCLSGPIQFLHVSHCVSLCLIVVSHL